MTLKSRGENVDSKDDGYNMTLIEAALYVAGRPLDVKTLGSIINTRSKRKVREIARRLMAEYKRRETSLEILELDDGRFVLQLKSEYSSKVKRLAVRPLLGVGPLKTLSYIAYHQPVTRKQVAEARGKHAYQHIKILRDMDLIKCEKNGRTSIIRTTEYFADYFGLSHDLKVMKKQLKKFFSDLMKKNEPARTSRSGNQT